jgi:hypothetical protein
MPLFKYVFNPGVNRESTSYSSENGWYNSNLIRFRKGRPEKMGGWSKLTENSFLGTPRSLFTWAALDGSKYMGVGTESKYYVEEGATFNDITPVRKTTTGTATFSATNGSTTITVTDTNHGAIQGDFVSFTLAASLGGNITAAVLNTEFRIQTVPSSNTYTITASATANSSDSGNGGSSTVAKYQLNIGLTIEASGTGFGTANFGGIVAGVSETTLNGAITSTTATSFALTSATDFETASTTISANVSIDETGSITVASASGLPSVGTIKIGSENIRYASKSGNVLNNLTRGSDSTTAAAHSSGASVTFVGLILIDQELILYTGKSTNTIDAGVVRGARGTTAATHADGAAVLEANDFVTWGGASSISTTDVLRLWQEDNWGEDLIFNIVDDTPYYWDKTLGLNTRGTDFASQSGASDAPTKVRQLLVSGTDRHVIALGSNALGSAEQDLLLVRWSDQEAPFDWTPTSTNTAGSQRLSTGSEIICGKKTRQETLIWTDSALYTMRFTGPPFTFGFALVSTSITAISINSVVSVGDRVFWMDNENFYAWTGALQVLPCTVLRYVFDDINLDQSRKFFACSNRLFDEVFFFYVSSSAKEIDRYVKFQYTDNTWDIGTLSRTAWVDTDIHKNPRGAGASGATEFIYVHENTENDDGSAMDSFIETADFDLDDGNNFMFVTKLIPDIVLSGTDPTVSYVIKTRSFPSDSLVTEATATVDSSTQKADVRCRGRTAALRIASNALDTAWTLGDTRLEIRQDGRR